MRSPARWIIGIVVTLTLFFTFLATSGIIHAQTTQQGTIEQALQPKLESNVPLDQHTLMQSVLIESAAAFGCQLVGIDIMAPDKPCLSVNWQTNQLGYAPQTEGKAPQIGGVLGIANQSIAFMYVPVTSSSEYFAYVSKDFGIVKNANAAPVSGFEALSPILPLWIAVRNIAYFLLTIVFVFIGIGVMLRVRIDPRTVMTVQNRIPDIIICILLITFSYGIAALMIDGMWLTAYSGINLITQTTDPKIPGCASIGGPNVDLDTVSKQANNQILSSPFTFVDAIFLQQCEEGAGPSIHSGILDVSKDIANSFVDLEEDIILTVLGVDQEEECSITNPIDCGLKVIFKAASWFAGFAWWLIIIITIVIAVFRLWFELLKAYLALLVYIITGPIWIVAGLLPKKPLGFNAWFRRLFANFAIFVASAWAIVFLRVVSELYKKDAENSFVPLLVGNPRASNFGSIILLGGLLMLPHLLGLIRDKVGAKPSNLAAAAGAGLAGGMAAAAVVPKKTMGRLNKRDQHGAALGPLAQMKDNAWIKTLDTAAKFKVPGAKSAAEKNKYIKETGTLRGYKPGWQGQAFAAKVDEHRGTLTPQDNPAMRYTRDEQGAKRFDLDEKIKGLKDRLNIGSMGAYSTRRANTQLKKLEREKGRMGNQGLEHNPNHVPTPEGTAQGGGNITAPGTNPAGGETAKGETPQVPELNVGVLNAGQIQLPDGGSLSVTPGEKAQDYVKKIMDEGAPEAAKNIQLPNITPEEMSPEQLATFRQHIQTNAHHIKEGHKNPPPEPTLPSSE